MNFTRCVCAIGVILALAAPMRLAHAQVIFVGGGLGKVCSEVADAVSKGKIVEPITVTGSNIHMGPLEVCTAAIHEEGLAGSDLAATYNNRGVIHFAHSRFNQATADFKKALSMDDVSADIHANLGGALVGLKRWNEAMVALNKGIEMQAAHPEKVYYNRAIIHEELNDARGAYFDYLKASELAPEWEAPRKHLARFSVRPAK